MTEHARPVHVFDVRSHDEPDTWHEVSRTDDPQRAFSIYVRMADKFPRDIYCLRWRCGDAVVLIEGAEAIDP